MDAEALRKTYNKRFLETESLWSSIDFKKTKKVVNQTISFLKNRGINFQSGNYVLDVGCALGYYTEAFRQVGFKAFGLDYSDVAIEKAQKNFQDCKFVQMDGLNPKLSNKFNLIFCRGFSGANSHDLKFVASWVNKYIDSLARGGIFIFSYSTNFSGEEIGDETVNWTTEEHEKLNSLIKAEKVGHYYFNYFGFISVLKRKLMSLLTRGKDKIFIYIVYQKR